MEAVMKNKPTYKTILFKDINCAAYQREINYSRCQEIKKHFNPDVVGTLLVSHRADGSFVIIDGHHRMTAMQMLGIKGHLCQVLEGLSYEEEARLFVQFNTKRATVAAKPLLRARVEAKETAAVEMMRLVNKAGYSCDTVSPTRGVVQISAVRALERAYKKLGDKSFVSMLNALGRIWPGNKDAVGQAMLGGMSTFFYYYNDKIEPAVLIKAFKGIDPKSFIARAKVVGDGGTRTAVAEEIWKQYNRCARGEQKLRDYQF